MTSLKSGDGSALALFAIGLAQAALAATEDACASFDAARNTGYPAGACLAAKANTLRAAAKLEEAADALSTATEEEKASPDFLASQGALAVERGDSNTPTLEILEKAVEADSGQPLALFCLGVLHDRLGNDDEAIDCYQRSLQRYPATVGALMNLGLLYEDRDDFLKAQQCYRRILDGLPLDAPGPVSYTHLRAHET